MVNLIPDLTTSQSTLVDRIADAVAVGDRVCVRGEPGSGKGTILRAAAGRVAAVTKKSVAVLDAQSADRLAWGVVQHSEGRHVRPSDLTAEGVVLLLDNGDCQVRIREEDPIVIVGDYAADVVIEIPRWERPDIVEATPSVAESGLQLNEAQCNPRFAVLAEACLQQGVSLEYPIDRCRQEYLVARLLERIEVESPLSVDFLFAASELGTLPICSSWFAGWRNVSVEEAKAAAVRLHHLGLVDPHSTGAFTASAVVRTVVRKQMSVAFRQAAAKALANRLLVVAEGRELDALPHLTTLWKRLRHSERALAERIWSHIAPQWDAYGFHFESADDSPIDVTNDVERLLVEARQLRQRGAVLEAEHTLAKAVRTAEASLESDDVTRLEARIEYAEVSLTGSRRPQAVAELRELLTTQYVQQNERQRYRIENDLASALFFDAHYRESAVAFRSLAESLPPGTGAARAWNNAGESCRTIGDFDQAEHALRTAVTTFESAGAAQDISATSAMLNLGAVLADTGRDAEAVPLFQSAVEIRKKLQGLEAASTQAAILNLAMSLARSGEVQRAKEVAANVSQTALSEATENAQAIVLAVIDRAEGRLVKSELALLRLSLKETLSNIQRAETSHLLAEGFLAEGMLEEATRWARVAVEAVRPIVRLAPATAVRSIHNAAMIESASGRWPEAGRLAAEAGAVSPTYGASSPQTALQRTAIIDLSKEPGDLEWSAVQDAYGALVGSSDCVDVVPMNRFIEHAAALSETSAALEVVTQTIDATSEVPRRWRVMQASLAVLCDDPVATELWKQIAETHRSKDAEEQRVAEKLAKDLKHASNGEPSVAESIGSGVNRLELSEMLLSKDRVSGDEVMEEPAADSADSGAEEPVGHVLDELF